MFGCCLHPGPADACTAGWLAMGADGFCRKTGLGLSPGAGCALQGTYNLIAVQVLAR